MVLAVGGLGGYVAGIDGFGKGEGSDDQLPESKPCEIDPDDAGKLDIAETHPSGIDEPHDEVEGKQCRHADDRVQVVVPQMIVCGGNREQRQSDGVGRQGEDIRKALQIDVDHRQRNADRGDV